MHIYYYMTFYAYHTCGTYCMLYDSYIYFFISVFLIFNSWVRAQYHQRESAKYFHPRSKVPSWHFFLFGAVRQ